MDDGLLRIGENAPVIVKLRYPKGREVEGRGGKRLMFTWADGRRSFVPLEVGAMIENQGIRIGQRFEVCRRVDYEGPERVTRWEVRPVDPGPTPREVAPSNGAGRPGAAAPRRGAAVEIHGSSGEKAGMDETSGAVLDRRIGDLVVEAQVHVRGMCAACDGNGVVAGEGDQITPCLVCAGTGVHHRWITLGELVEMVRASAGAKKAAC